MQDNSIIKKSLAKYNINCQIEIKKGENDTYQLVRTDSTKMGTFRIYKKVIISENFDRFITFQVGDFIEAFDTFLMEILYEIDPN